MKNKEKCNYKWSFIKLVLQHVSVLLIGILSVGVSVSVAQQTITYNPADLGVFPVGQDNSFHGVTKFQFRTHLVDDDFPTGAISQTALCDFTGDGQLEYHVGGAGGNFIYKFQNDGTWTRTEIRRITPEDRKSTRLNSSHVAISYAVFC